MIDDSLLKSALEKVPNKPLLINMVARRVRQLNAGARPLVEKEYETPDRIALMEIAAGKLEVRHISEGKNIAEEVMG